MARIKFECSNGEFEIEVKEELAPIGVAHFLELVRKGFYDGARFFRVVPGFIVQFGIAGDPAVQRELGDDEITDDPVKISNSRGTITYATRGPDTRTTQLFINYNDNAFLDGQGFSPFGEVVSGMEVVDAINSEYGEKPHQGQIQSKGNEYLEASFPNMDYIIKATVTEE